MKDGVYEESDYVEVVDQAGRVQENKIPKQWLGTPFGEGLKKASKSDKQQDAPPPPPADTEPAGNASTEDWAAYARTKGATDADLVDGDGKPLGRDEIRAKYGSSGE